MTITRALSLQALISFSMLFVGVNVAQAETVSIKWKPSASVAWVPGNDYIDG